MADEKRDINEGEIPAGGDSFETLVENSDITEQKTALEMTIATSDVTGNAKKSFRKKKLRRGAMSVAMTAIVVAGVILLNIIVNMLITRFDVKIDLTDSRLYTIEDSTIDYISKLDDEITLIISSDEQSIQNMDIYYSQMNEIAKLFAAKGKSFKLQYVNLQTNPSFSGEYGGNVTSANIIVKSKNTGRYKVLAPQDYLDVKYVSADGQVLSEENVYYYQMIGQAVYQDISAAAEQNILSAIMSVTNATSVRIAFTNGFGEDTPTSSNTYSYTGMKDLLDINAYDTETIDMNLTAEIDPEIDVLVIYAPSADYSNKALEAIDKWLDNGAKLGKSLVYVSGLTNVSTPNLDSFLEEWGLYCEKGFIWQTNTNFISTNNIEQYLSLPTSDYSKGKEDKTFIGYYVRAVTALYEEYANITTIPILTSYNGAVVAPFEPPEDWNPNAEQTGVLNAIIESRKTRYEDSTPYSSRVIVAGSPNLFSEYFLTAEQIGHAELVVDMFSAISGREASVALTSKSFWMPSFNISAGQAIVIAVIFCVLLPIIIFVTGLVVWIRRRHL